MIIPNKKVKEMLNTLNKQAEAYVVGRSLISIESKDVDFVVFGDENCYERITLIDEVRPYFKTSRPANYISEDFPWHSFIKGRNEDYEFDILFCNFSNDIKEVISGFPITKQHIAFGLNGFIISEYFCQNSLSLSPEMRMKKQSSHLKMVMEKYCGYYPDDEMGKTFVESLKYFAFKNNEINLKL